ncbi:MAG: dienelactone hydrolase family protein [Bacteriovoracaceae bacterium]
MKNLLILFLITLLTSCSSLNKHVTYKIKDQDFSGYFVKAKGEGKKPAIIVVHEWWGLNDYARKRADMLSELGYHAFALDMYGKGKRASHPKEAKAFAQETLKNPKLVKQKFDKVIEILKNDKDVDPDNIAAIGYCFGGGIVLNMARMGSDLKGVISYHGSLTPLRKAKRGQVKAKVLVFNGDKDGFVPKKDIRAFKREMRRAKVDYRFENITNAKHSFTNPIATEVGKKFGLPLEYNKEADELSWRASIEFFDEIF